MAQYQYVVTSAQLTQVQNQLTTYNDEFLRRVSDLEKLQQQLRELEAEKLKNKDMMQSIDLLRQVITKELNFEHGFSEGVIDTLLDHIEVNGTDKKNEISAKVYLKAMPEAQKYSIQRIRGSTSVCTRQYT